MQIVVAVETSAQTALIVGLTPYNDNVRIRGTCDNRNSNLTASWTASGELWSPFSSVNSPLWLLSRTPFVGGFEIATYTADFTLNDFFGCVGSNGENNLVVGSMQNTIFEGELSIAKVVPRSLYNEAAGEIVQYEKECSFQIHQEGQGVDTINYINSVGTADVTIRWLRSLCTETGRIAFSIRTCVNKNADDDGYDDSMYLYDPMILGSQSAPNGTFSMSSVGSVNACGYQTSTVCCQEWLIRGLTDDAEPPFVGAVRTYWKYGNVDDDVLISNVYATINAFVLDACDPFNDVYVNDTLEGNVELFRDPGYNVHYECCSGTPIFDRHRVYAALILDVDFSLCGEFSGLFTNVTLVYYKPTSEGGGVLETVLIYDVNNPGLAESEDYDVTVETDPGEPCLPKISWLALKKACGDAKVDVIIAWNVTHVPYPNNYPVAPDFENEGIATGAATVAFETKTVSGIRQSVSNRLSSSSSSSKINSRFSPSVRAPTKNSTSAYHYGTHSKSVEENKHIALYYKFTTNKFAIYKDHLRSRIDRKGVKKNEEKISKLTGIDVQQQQNSRYVRFRFTDRIDQQRIHIACSEFSEWDHDDRECSRNYFLHWFPGARDHPNQRGWLLATLIFVLIMFCVPVLFLCFSHHHHRHHPYYPMQQQKQHHHQHHHHHREYEVRKEYNDAQKKKHYGHRKDSQGYGQVVNV